MPDNGLNIYWIEAETHRQQYLSELNELQRDLLDDNFRSRDYRASQRLLQIFTELCIGLSRHWLKTIQNKATNEAYQVFSLLRENGQISSEELVNWKKIIGMRNSLVHDYLNMDLTILENIIRNKQYVELSNFCQKAIIFLQKKNLEN